MLLSNATCRLSVVGLESLEDPLPVSRLGLDQGGRAVVKVVGQRKPEILQRQEHTPGAADLVDDAIELVVQFSDRINVRGRTDLLVEPA